MLRTGNKPLIVIDLFSGCGGFSLGAARAGFSVVAAVDNDVHAIKAHEKNFPQAAHLTADLAKLDGADLCKQVKLSEDDVDGVIGGPPCQGFSNIGRRNKDDSRNLLFPRFFEIVSEIRPRFFLCENVPGLLDDQYADMRSRALSLVADDYRILPTMKLRANDFGAPTTRTRMFLLGFRRDQKCACDARDFAPPAEAEIIVVKDALAGLPKKISDNWLESWQGWRKVGESTNGAFGARLSGHVPEGVGDVDALRRLREEGRVSGCLGTRHTSDVVARFTKVAPGKIDRVSRFPRLDPNDFCPTLRAGTGADKGSHQAARPIHPTEDRVITPREAARLQGFPDWFQFSPTKWHGFRQIGNSVSPILAEYILVKIHETLRGRTNDC